MNRSRIVAGLFLTIAAACGGTEAGAFDPAVANSAALTAAPSILALNRTGSPPEGGMMIIMIGSNLDPAATIAINGAPATDVHYDPNASATADSNLVFTTPANPEGFYDVVVTNPDGQFAAYTHFHYGPPPAISSVAPLSVRKYDQVTITGANFAAQYGVSVNVGGAPAQILSKSDTQLVISAPKLNAGTYQVSVFNFDSQYAVAADRLTYR